MNRDDPSTDHRLTIDQALFAARRLLGQSGIETAALDARILLQWATGLTAEQLVMRGGEELPDDAGKRFEEAIAARRRGMPVSRWMGRREFWGMDLALGPETLDPRPDTETLVAAVLARLGTDVSAFHPRHGNGNRCHPPGASEGAAAGARAWVRPVLWRTETGTVECARPRVVRQGRVLAVGLGGGPGTPC